MFTASSVKEALNANTNLKIEGELGCPLKKIRDLNSNERRQSNCNAVCYGDYKNCSYIPLKCKQTIRVIAEIGQYILPFYFTIDKNSQEGAIEEQNIALATLIKRNLINSKMLKIA
jgi:hypothetical protein